MMNACWLTGRATLQRAPVIVKIFADFNIFTQRLENEISADLLCTGRVCQSLLCSFLLLLTLQSAATTTATTTVDAVLVVVLSNPPAKINKNKCRRKNIMKLITVYIFMFSQATRCCFQFFIICLYLNFECLAIFQMLGIARFYFKQPNNQFFMHNDHPNTRRSRKRARLLNIETKKERYTKNQTIEYACGRKSGILLFNCMIDKEP